MLVTQKRPRVLKWYHAGPLLFGDWGTSRLYVLGLAFFYTAHASVFYLTALSVLMAAVAWAYTVICRCFPEGGGVYTAARQINPMLAVIGGTLLLADYIVTASLSTLEAFKYFGVSSGGGGLAILSLSITAIVAIGVVNWLGARNAGRFALLIAVVSLVFSGLIAVLCIPFVGEGLRTVTVPKASPWGGWTSFVHIVLALSGVEAVANMTGLMKQPVARTAKRTVWPVLFEVALLNILFGIALTGLPALRDVVTPDSVTYAGGGGGGGLPHEVEAVRDTAMKVLAIESGQHWFGQTAGFIFGKTAAIAFGLLLLSAANTAVVAMIAVMYSMAQDRELPRPLTRLNYSGVPAWPLVIAVLLPILVLTFERDVQGLADLYAIGVCGAITINILSCAFNRALPINPAPRAGLFVLGGVIGLIWLTIAVTKLNALVFAGGLVGAVLLARFLVAAQRRALPEAVPEPATGWLAELQRGPIDLDPSKPRIMLAARGRYQAEFAVDLARRRGATLFAIYVRTLRVMDIRPGAVPRVENDPAAMESLGSVAVLARQYRVPFVPIYVTSPEISEEILDYTVTYGCDTLILGKSRRRWFSRRLEGDVVTRIAENLPNEVALITRDADPHPMPPPPPAPPQRNGEATGPSSAADDDTVDIPAGPT